MNLFSPTTIQSRIELMIFGKRPFMPPIRSKYITVTQQQPHTVSAEKTFRPPNNVAKATVIIIKCIISNGDWWVINKTLRNARLPPIDPDNKKRPKRSLVSYTNSSRLQLGKAQFQRYIDLSIEKGHHWIYRNSWDRKSIERIRSSDRKIKAHERWCTPTMNLLITVSLVLIYSAIKMLIEIQRKVKNLDHMEVIAVDRSLFCGHYYYTYHCQGDGYYLLSWHVSDALDRLVMTLN